MLEEEIAVFTDAAAWTTARVAEVSDTAWDGPGLGDWDMRALVGHTSRALLTVEQYLGAPAEAESVGSAEAYYAAVARMPVADSGAVLQRGIDAGDALGADPPAAFRAISDRVIALLADETDRLINTLVGGIRLSNYLPTRTFELVVHGLDISRGAGLHASVPERPLRRSLKLAVEAAVGRGRGEALLLALTGRGGSTADLNILD